MHFNFACAGLPSMPEKIDPKLAQRIGAAVRQRKLEMVAVSGTFNMIHPDRRVREDGFQRLGAMATVCPEIGTKVITLCSGTRDPDDMWRAHPHNNSADAWKDLLNGMLRALTLAEQHDLILGIEPELGNVVNSAAKARQLLSDAGSPRLKIIFDAANLQHGSELPHTAAIWREAIELLKSDIIMTHAKDLTLDEQFVAAGRGDLDFDLYLRLLRNIDFDGPIILHGLQESEAKSSIQFLRKICTETRPGALKGPS
jgi:sugar phosphate isomerase/epimerase